MKFSSLQTAVALTAGNVGKATESKDGLKRLKSFILIVDDCDSDEPSVEFFETQEAAEKAGRKHYRNAPGVGESEGNTYSEDETPNSVIYIAEIVSVAVL
jgi:hypothetical protein